MGVLIGFLIFIICIAASIFWNISMIVPLLIGMCIFSFLAMRKGYSIKDVAKMAVSSFHDSSIVIIVMILIGFLTGLWRLNGTIAYFVYLGVNAIPPRFFVLAAFLICTAVSYAIGTSFGVTATAGVIVISIARAGNIPTALVAGAILSGVYVGDRGSPAASSANLVASLTGTDMRINIRQMLKTSIVPFLLCCGIYAVFSLNYPMESGNSNTLKLLSEEFRLNPVCLLPAILMIVLPFCKINIKLSMGIDIVVSIITAMVIQKASVLECLSAAVLGYQAVNPELADVISGGGLKSMVEICFILLISGTYGAIFQGTGLLQPITDKLDALVKRIGRFPVMIVLSTGICAVFCNQTIGCIMLSQISSGLYSKEEKYRKMMDMENSVITIAGLVPWCIACSVPLSMLNADSSSVFYAFFLWLIPIYNLIVKHKVEEKESNSST